MEPLEMKQPALFPALCVMICLLSVVGCDQNASQTAKPSPRANVHDASCDDPSINVLAIKQTDAGKVCLVDKDVDEYVFAVIPEGDMTGFFADPARMDQILNVLMEQKIVSLVGRSKNYLKTDVGHKQVYPEYRKGWLAAIQVPDYTALVKEDFQKNRYVEPALYSVKHVLFTGDTAYEEASDVHAKIDSGVISFDEAVQTYSKDEQTREKNGLIENIEPNQTERAFEQAFTGLKPMEVSEPIITDHGVHLIQLVAVTPERAKTFDEVKDDIKARLEKSYLDTAFKAEITQITRGSVTLNPENIQALRTKYMAIKSSTAPQAPAAPNPEAQ